MIVYWKVYTFFFYCYYAILFIVGDMMIGIRLYDKDDFLVVNDILKESFSYGKKTDKYDDDHIQLVVTVDELVCGYLLLTRQVNFINDKVFFWMDYVCVKSEYRGRGLGRKLVEEGIKIAYENGASYVQLFSAHHREAARHLYESLGFVMRESDIYRKVLV